MSLANTISSDLLQFINSFPEAIYAKDLDGRFVFVNEAHAKGVREKYPNIPDPIGRTDEDLFKNKNELQKILTDDQKVYNGQFLYDHLEKTTFPYQSEHAVSTTKVPWFGENNDIIGLLGISRDVTGRVDLFHQLFNSHPECCFITSREGKGKWIHINQAGLDLFGYNSLGEIQATNVIDVYADEKERGLYMREIAKNGYLKNHQIDFLNKTGKKITVHVSSSVRRNSQGRIIGYHGMIKDLTHQEKVIKELKERTHCFQRNLIRSIAENIEIYLSVDKYSHCDLSVLTKRQREIYMLVAQDKNSREVAEYLGLTIRTIETHCRNIYDRLKFTNHQRSLKGIRKHSKEKGHKVGFVIP